MDAFASSGLPLCYGCCASFISGNRDDLFPSDESFERQFANVDSASMREVELEGPLGSMGSYRANPIDTIYCVDKSGKPHELVNGPQIEVRFTEENGKRVILYFDTVVMQDSMIVGSESRFIPSVKDAISVKSIRLIEVQNGGKDFHYGHK